MNILYNKNFRSGLYKLTALSLAIAALFSSPAQASAVWSKHSDGVYNMIDGSKITGVYARGVDVSHWQGDIDWKAVAKDDVKFLMHGVRTMRNAGPQGRIDPKFDYNVRAAHKEGIAIGAYIYSYAKNVQEAEMEADFLLNIIKDYPISYPIAFDVEDENVQGKMSKAELTAIIKAFTTKIRDAGYYPILYANDYWIANKLDMNAIKDLDIWVARYNKRHIYPNPAIWQATEKGKVNGVKGNVDINFQYKNFFPVIKKDTFRTILGKTYYYKDYVMQKNAWITDNNKTYYMDAEGLIYKSWKTDNGHRYYLDETTGVMQTGWKKFANDWYYFGNDGKMATSWVNDGNARYYLNAQGVMQTGWLTEGSHRYYLKSSGALATGFTDIDGSRYYMNSDGIIQKSWVKVDNKWYHLNNDGIVQKFWIKLDTNWYYMNQDGVMQTGWLKSDNNWYYLSGEGSMKTGWQKDGNSWYFLKKSGIMATSWVEDAGKWYYMDNSGAMKTGLIEINGIKYMLSADGSMLSSTTINHEGRTYNIDASGVMTEVVQETTQPTEIIPQDPNQGVNNPSAPGSKNSEGPSGKISAEAPKADNAKHIQQGPQ